MESRGQLIARYDPEADALIIILRPRGRLSHAEEEGSIVIHYDESGRVLAIEILEASKLIPRPGRGPGKEARSNTSIEHHDYSPRNTQRRENNHAFS